VSDIQGNCRLVVFQLLAESIGQTSKAALLHPKGEVLPLDANLQNRPATSAIPESATIRRFAHTNSPENPPQP
jgi:hypothetical protein